jgi:hypothetical protein
MKRPAPALIGTLLAAFTFLPAAFGGVAMNLQTKIAGGDTIQTSAAILPDRLRLTQGDTEVIFRADKQVVWVVEKGKGQYTEITKEQLKQVGEQLQGAMAQIKEEMKNLPPEQRAMVEQMMQKQMPKAESPKPTQPRTYVKGDKTETINGHPCALYNAMRGDKKEQQIWVTDWKPLGLDPKDMAVFDQLGEFMKDAVGPLTKTLSIGLDQKYADAASPDALPGVPIRVVTPTEKGDTVMEIKKIAREDIAPASFEVPQGLKKVTLDAGTRTMKIRTAGPSWTGASDDDDDDDDKAGDDDDKAGDDDDDDDDDE